MSWQNLIQKGHGVPIRVKGPIKVNQEFSFFGFVQFQVCWTRFFFVFEPQHLFGFQTWDSLHVSISVMNLFLSNCWLLVFVFLQGSALKTRVLSFFLSSLAQQSRIRVFKFYFVGLKNPGFQFSASNPTWIWKPKKKTISNLRNWILGLL